MPKPKLSVSIMILAILCSLIMTAQQDKKNLQGKKAQLEKEIAETNKELELTKQNKTANLKQLVLIDKKIGKREELIGELGNEIGTIEKQVNTLNDSITRISRNLDELKDEYAKIIYSTYKNKGANNRLMFIFASKNFNQAYKRIKYLQQYTDYRKSQVKAITEYRLMIAKKKTELEKTKTSKLTVKQRQEIERNNLANERKDKDQHVKKLTAQEQKLLTKLRNKQAASRKLQAAIEALVAAEIKKANEEKARKAAELAESNLKTTENKTKNISENKTAIKKPVAPTSNSMSITAEDVALTGSFAGNKGRLPSPFDRSSILSSFGEHPHPEFQNIRIKNNGIDLISTANAQVKAVFDGVVSSTLFIADLNYVIIISHGDYLSVYSNLSKVNVKKGDKVKIRQIIGIAATDEEDQRSKLHFELWLGTQLLNPVNWLNL